MSVSNNINIAKVCVSLTIRAIEQGLEKDLLLPRKLDISQKVVNDINTDDPTNADLPLISNQLYAMCGGYAFEAQRVLNLGGAGIVGTTTSNTGLSPYPIGHTITVAESNSSTLQNSEWIGLTDLNTTATINNNQFTYGVNYTFSTITGTFDFSLSGYLFQTGDVFATGGFMPVT